MLGGICWATAFNSLLHLSLRGCSNVLSAAKQPARPAAASVRASWPADTGAGWSRGFALGTLGSGLGGLAAGGDGPSAESEAAKKQREQRDRGKLLLKAFPSLESVDLSALRVIPLFVLFLVSCRS
jgi:hypothetical protein